MGDSNVVLRSASYRFDRDGAIRFPDLDVAPGTRCVVRGLTGSGKSTLCRVLARRLPSGFVSGLSEQIQVSSYFAGTLDAAAFTVPEVAYIGPVPVRQLLAVRVSDFFGRESVGASLLDSLGLDVSYLSRDPATLSTGEATRVLLAAAMASGRPVVLDGPWTWLDAGSRAAVADQFFDAMTERLVIDAEGPIEASGGRLSQHSVVMPAPTAHASLTDLFGAFSPGQAPTRADDLVEVSVELRIATGRRTWHEVAASSVLLATGAVTWIEGVNGSGKTTTSRALAALSMPGEVELARCSVTRADGSRASVGYVANLAPDRATRLAAVREALLGCHRVPPMTTVLDAPARLLAELPETLAALLRKVCEQLRLQRHLIILDEPFLGITSGEFADLWRLFQRIAHASGAAIAVVSHLPPPAGVVVDKLEFRLARSGHARHTTVATTRAITELS